MNSENENQQSVNDLEIDKAMQPEDAMGEFGSAMDYMETVKKEVWESSVKTADEGILKQPEETADVIESAMSNESPYAFFEEEVKQDTAKLSEQPVTEKNTVEPEKVSVEEASQNVENSAASVKEKFSADSEIVAEFAPAPMKIPNYNREKEQKKAAKESEKKKKRSSKKSKKRREALYKFVFVARTILLFVLMVSVIATMLFSLLVKMNTTQYSMERAISESDPGRFIIGKIPDAARDELELAKSSPSASLLDIVRDNKMSDRTVTYTDIEYQISKSTYPRFLAKIAHDIADYYLFGNPYQGISEEDIAVLIEENAGRIQTVTGRTIGATGCKEFASYIKESNAFAEISEASVKAQKMNHDTEATSFLFSTMMLILLVVALILMIILSIIACKGFAHKMIGWATIIAGVTVGIAGYFTGSLFVSSNDFIKCIIDVLVTSFNQSALIWSGISIVVGVIVMILGKAISENEDDDYDDDDYEDDDYEEDYIDEIEQVSTAQ